MVHSHSRVLFSYKKEWGTELARHIVQMNLEKFTESERSHMKDHKLDDSTYEMSDGRSKPTETNVWTGGFLGL